MKLGVNYVCWEGEELLEWAIRPIRLLVDFISVTYHEISYRGEHYSPRLTLEKLCNVGLIDQITLVEPSPGSQRDQETNARNLGTSICRAAGCTHHISADVDEFWEPAALDCAKAAMENYDCSVVPIACYFKTPNWRLCPDEKFLVTFIQDIKVDFSHTSKFPFRVDATRKPATTGRCREFKSGEFIMHHMSFVRKDIARKLRNSANRQIDFDTVWRNHNQGDTVVLAPDFRRRRTTYAENLFNIPKEAYGCDIGRGS